MCDFAVAAEKVTPSNALFVDYSNLPDAVPEYVFPEHFGVAAEVAQVRHNARPTFFGLQTKSIYSSMEIETFWRVLAVNGRNSSVTEPLFTLFFAKV